MGVLFCVPEMLRIVLVLCYVQNRLQFMIFYKVFLCANVDHCYCEYVNTRAHRNEML